VWVGLGANLGDPLEQLRQAIAALRADPRLRVIAVSSLYRTRPVEPAGGEPQPDYLNAAVAVETELSPRDLLALGSALEAAAGRRRSGILNQARPLDIDLLLAGPRVIREPDLEIPHPRMAKRAFVLVPLAEIAPGLVHPVLHVRISELAKRVPQSGVSRIAGPEWAGWGADAVRPFGTN